MAIDKYESLKIHVLAVDDELDVLGSMSRFLRLDGFEVMVATNMNAAIRRLNTQEIHVVITDYAMKGGTGNELCAYVRHYFPHIPVILFSCMASTANVVEAMQLGAVTFLEKPVSPEELAEQLRKTMGKDVIEQPLRTTLATPDPDDQILRSRVRAFEKYLIEQALQAHGGNVKDAMLSLGLNRRTMNEKMSRLGITRGHTPDLAE